MSLTIRESCFYRTRSTTGKALSELLKDKLKYIKILKSLFEQTLIQVRQLHRKWLEAFHSQELGERFL